MSNLTYRISLCPPNDCAHVMHVYVTQKCCILYSATFSVRRKNEILPFVTKLMDVDVFIFNRMKQIHERQVQLVHTNIKAKNVDLKVG